MMEYPRPYIYDPNTAGGFFDEERWAKSFASEPNGGNCVEVNVGTSGLVGLRDTKLPAGPVLVFDTGEWEAFLAGVKAGQFDLRC